MSTPARQLLGPRPSRTTLLVGLLAGTLGFALAVQVRSTRGVSGLATAREEDLVRILDDLESREERLRLEIDELRRTRDRLTSGLDQDSAALTEARRRVTALGILAGTVPAKGPGIVLTVSDPERSVRADVLLDAIQELRDAGAEAIMVNGVRLVASSSVVDVETRVAVDGRTLDAPYTFTAVGDAHTLAEAMEIPGGVFDVVAAKSGASARVEERAEVLVDALRSLPAPRYARPSSSQASQGG